MIARRSIFIGNGFPFNEKYFKEYTDRKFSVHGTTEQLLNIDGDSIHKKYRNFYYSLSPEYFKILSRK